jgi:hypothetical protein
MKETLNEAAAANIQTGVLLFVKEALCTAMFDRRLDRGHRLVLSAIAMHINGTTAKAWPGRDILAQITGLSPKTVSNSIAELGDMGYLIRDRENVPEANNRKLTVYTFGNVDHETIRREVGRFINRFRGDGQSSPPVGNSTEVPSPRGTQSSPPTGKFPAGGAESSPPAGRSNSEREPSPYGGAEAPKVSLKEVIWKQGLAWLASVYGNDLDPAEIRSRVGKLIKDHGQGLVLDALGKAEAQGVIHPLDFMTAILTKNGKPAAKKFAPSRW